jgi:hypothetical protein
MNIESTRQNMNEKLSWMMRSQERMLEHIEDPVAVQDHFLSYIHASRLIWFYFGRYLKAINREGKAGDAIDTWKLSLSPEELDVWDIASSLRTEDVHVQPIKIENTGQPSALTIGGSALTIGGSRLVIGKWRHEVDFKGEPRDIFFIVEKTVPLFKKFIDEFGEL